ncbi:MAG: hypothetical protein J0I06_15390 [Planctomycetes bacterium]|nr:hypothetical protein [Planctomycetota bacterium]
MDWELGVKIVGGVATVAGAAWGAIKFVSKAKSLFDETKKRLDDLRLEVKQLQTQNDALRTQISTTPVGEPPDYFEQLKQRSAEIARALGAPIHSVSVPVPRLDPVELKIIFSTDPKAEQVIGKQFPIDRSLAGRVFQTQQASFKNPEDKTVGHFGLVDKVAKTKTGEGAILTVPLSVGTVRHGVVQFMKPAPQMFGEADVSVATTQAPALARLLAQMADPARDIPSVPSGDQRQLCVLFTDVAGFTKVCSQIRLHDAVAMLNEYYTRLLACALELGGQLEEYVGDGLYVWFPHDGTRAAVTRAVTAARNMRTTYRKLLQEWKDYEQPVSDQNALKIGIATDVVYTGMVGHPQARRQKLIGRAVNLAAHLCEEAGRNSDGLLICPNTRAQLDDSEWSFSEIATRDGVAYSVQDPKG